MEKGDAATKAFAQKMVQDHEKTTADLSGLVSSGKVKATLPKTMTTAQKDMLAKLNDLKGEDFGKQYRSDQQQAHEDAVDLFKRYSEGGENAELQAWAAKTLPALEHHLEMAKNLIK